MNRILPLLFILAFSLSASAQCEDGRYTNLIFAEHTLTSDIQYGSNVEFNGNDIDLFLDVYEPSGDMETDRPLVIVSHGGSFVGGSKDGTDVVPLCEDLARMGYVVASIQYRLGIDIFGPIVLNAKQAVIRGAQDSKAAVRYFRRDVAENGNTFNIDPEHIYMAGVSAGGFNALNVAYLNTDDEIPSDINLNGEGLEGGAEGVSGNEGYSSAIAGVVNIAGAIAELEMIQEGEVPICSFHGTGDAVVPYGSDMLTLFSVIEIDTVHGSESIHERANELGIENCFQIQLQEGHVPHVSNTLHYDTLIGVASNFLSYLVCPDIELDCEYDDIEIISSTEELNALNEVVIWPNPVNNVLRFGGISSKALAYSIFDITGKQIESGQITDSFPEIDTHFLKNGLYVIQLESNGLHPDFALRQERLISK